MMHFVIYLIKKSIKNVAFTSLKNINKLGT